jgi:autotransporter-associated beta strand protein
MYLRRALTCPFLLVAVCFFAIQLCAFAQIPSFPGAIGYGGTTSGACSFSGTNHVGGNVYVVTNLNDSGAGSFRTGVGTSGNIVVFAVGGNINILTPVSVTSNIDIEGQTAPGGIQIFGAEVSFFNSSNIICRFVHFRDGTLDPNYPGPTSTNSSTNAANLGDTTNVIMDHCSFEFAAYNNIDAGGNGAVNSTIQYCIFADPISYQQFNFHLQGGPTTMVGNLMANSHGRNPLGKADLQFVNNIVYNYGYAMTTGNSAGAFHWDIVNNYFISGPSTNNANDAYYQVDSTQQAYAIGNFLDGNDDGVLNGSADNSVSGATVLSAYWFPNSSEPIATTSLPTVSAQAAYYDVLSNAGPLPRDQVDSQVVGQVESIGTTGSVLEYQYNDGLGNTGYGTITPGTALPDTDNAGMPDDWKAAMGLSLTNPAISGSTSSTGYTNLENYLAWKAQPNTWVAKNTAAQPTSVTIDLSQFGNGFAAGSTYTVSGTINGTVAQSGTGGYLVTFTPKLSTSGLGGFNWSVTNGIATLSSTMGVLISQNGPSQSVVWKGDGVNNYWDSTTSNWTVLSTGSASTFASTDPVTFNDTGSVSPAVNVVTSVAPGNMTFNTYSDAYSISGTGIIAGSGLLDKEGTATLTIGNTNGNTFSGGVLLNGGTIYFTNGASLGSGAVTMNGGDLEINANISPGNALVVNEGSTLGLDAKGSDVFLGGAVSGAGALVINFNTTGVVFTPQGNWGGYTGTLTVNGAGNFRVNDSASWGFPSAVVNITGGSGVYNRSGGSATIAFGALNLNSTSSLAGSDQGTSGTGTYLIGSLNQSSHIAGPINNSTGQIVALTSTGSGTLTLSASSNYTGPTTVGTGSTLLLNGTLGNTALTVQTGATFITNTVVNGSVNMNTGGSIYLGTSTSGSAAGTLVCGTGMTLASGTGAHIYYDLSNSPAATGSNDLITVTTGTLTMSGSTHFVINPINGTLGAGTYNLINGNAILAVPGGGTVYALDLPIPAGGVTRQTINLSRPASGASPGYITLLVTGSAGNLEWSGSNGANWDLNTTADWSGASPGTFFDLDQVTFDDTDSGGTVTLTGTLAPISVTVSANTSSYTWAGTGGFAGSTSITKAGSGTLTIQNSGNIETGPIYLNAGTIIAQASLGTGTIYLNGGILSMGGSPSTGYFFSNSMVVNVSSTLIGISGNIYLLNIAGNTLTCANSNTVLNLSFGTLISLSYDMSAFNGTIEFGSSTGTLRLNGGTGNTTTGSALAAFDLGTSTGTLTNRNGNTTLNLGSLAGGPGTSLSGRTSGSGQTITTYIVGGRNTNATFGGTIYTGNDLAGVDIEKVGTGNWTLGGTSNWIGTVTVQGGTLTITGSDNNGSLNFETETGCTLALLGGTISTDTVQIDSGAIFTGAGTINGNMTNQGTATITTGTLTVNGGFENDGTMTVDTNSALAVNLNGGGSGTFVNNGLLDIMDSPQSALPSGYVNNGTILNSSLVALSSFGKSGNTFSATIHGYSGHTYQLQKSTSLATWQNVGSSQSGNTGSAVVLSDTNATSSAVFYKVAVGP